MKETLCWSCQVPGTSGCSWDKNLEPVDGWTAEKTRYRITKERMDTSYLVKDCPIYQPLDQRGRDSSKGGVATVMSDEALALFMAAGLTDKEISDRVGLAEATVNRRRRDLLRKRRLMQENEETEADSDA